MQTTQHSGAPLKIKRLARDPEKFIWAVSMAQSRCINMQIRVGALTQDTNMLIPYAGKLLSLNTALSILPSITHWNTITKL
jgi:hypothetical protein